MARFDRKRLIPALAAAAAVAAIPALAIASETLTYSYDSKGRLVKVERSGDVNQGVKAQYKHDKADNRTEVNVTVPAP